MFLRCCSSVPIGQEFLCLNSHRAGLFYFHFQTLSSIADFLPPLFLPPQSVVLSHFNLSFVLLLKAPYKWRWLDMTVRELLCFVLLIWHNGLNQGIIMLSSLFRLTSSYSSTSSGSSCPNWGRTKWDILTTSSGGCPAVWGLVHPKM